MGNVISFDPNDMVTGGMLDNANATVKDAGFCVWDYNGKAPKTLAAYLHFVTDDGTEDTQYYSAGKDAINKFQPTANGKSLTSLTGTGALGKNSNFGILNSALVEVGFPRTLLAQGDMSVLVGLYAFWQRKPNPDRGLDRQAGSDNCLVPTKIIRMPGEKKAAGPSAAADGDDVEQIAKDYVIGLLESKGGKVSRKAVNTMAFSKLSKEPKKNAVIKLLSSEEFFASLAEDGIAADEENIFYVG